MCFFDQQVYLCGDLKWGLFREHCVKEYRTGETCGMKFVKQNIHIHTKCRICDKLEIKYDRRAKQEDRIKRWKKEGGRKASLEAAEDIIDKLNDDITRLIQERYDRAMKLPRLPVRNRKDDGPGFKKPIEQNNVSGFLREPIEEESAVLEDKVFNKSQDSGLLRNRRSVVISNGEEKENSAVYKHTSRSISSPTTCILQPQREGIDEDICIAKDRKCTSGSFNNPFEITMHENLKLSQVRVVDPGKEESWNHPRIPLLTAISRIPSVKAPDSGYHVAYLASDGTMGGNPQQTDEMGSESLSEVGSIFRKRLLPWQVNNVKTLTSSEVGKESNLSAASPQTRSDLLTREALSPGGAPTISSNSPEKGVVRMCVGSMTIIPESEVFAKAFLPSVPVKSPIPPAYEATPFLPMESNVADHKSTLVYTGIVENVLSLTQQTISDYLVQEFYVLFDQTWSANLKEYAEGSSSSSRSNRASESILESNTSRASAEGKKRGRDNLEEDDPSQNGASKPQKHRPNSEMAYRRLACPFFKRDPDKFGIGTPRHVCAGQGWKDIAKLKEHLYRKHNFFFQCQRCKAVLASQLELNDHVEAATPCPSRCRQLEDGFDQENFLLLKRKTQRGQTEAERWKEIFSRLFPDHPIPSPYLSYEICGGEAKDLSEFEELEDFEAYRQREVPVEFARLATVEVLRSSTPILRHLASQVPNMTRDAHETVSRGYQTTLSPGQQEDSNSIHSSSLTRSLGASLLVQSTVCPVLDQNFQNATNNNPSSDQSSRLRGTEQAVPPMNMRSFDDELGLNDNRMCYCIGPCTCFNTLPLSFPTESFAGERDPLVLQILQDISSRLAKLERQSANSISPYALNQPALIDLASMNCNSTATGSIRDPLSRVDIPEIPHGLTTPFELIKRSTEKDKNGFDLDMLDFHIL